jgi:hypothetical protein
MLESHIKYLVHFKSIAIDGTENENFDDCQEMEITARECLRAIFKGSKKDSSRLEDYLTRWDLELDHETVANWVKDKAKATIVSTVNSFGGRWDGQHQNKFHINVDIVEEVQDTLLPFNSAPGAQGGTRL